MTAVQRPDRPVQVTSGTDVFVLWAGLDFGPGYLAGVFTSRAEAERVGGQLRATVEVVRQPLWVGP